MQALQEGVSSSDLPLILIHDAGGTIYSYCSLGSLSREVYAIANPRFDSGTPWANGVMEMAQCYYAMIKSRWPKGDILLGGWSLGGIVALQTAWILALDPNVRVHGIVMIDCPFPFEYEAGDTIDMPPAPPGMSKSLHESLGREVRQSVDMLRIWRVPRWTARQGDPPPTIMLRASDTVPVQEDGKIPMVDKFRSDEMLGWGACKSAHIKQSTNLPGNHFSIFDSQNVSTLTTALKNACATLEMPPRRDSHEDM